MNIEMRENVAECEMSVEMRENVAECEMSIEMSPLSLNLK